MKEDEIESVTLVETIKGDFTKGEVNEITKLYELKTPRDILNVSFRYHILGALFEVQNQVIDLDATPITRVCTLKQVAQRDGKLIKRQNIIRLDTSIN